MGARLAAVVVGVVALGLPASASADFAHVVVPGETLSSVAAADGLTVAELAAANGMSLYSQLIAGSTLMIPPQTGVAGGGAVTISGEPAGDDSGTEVVSGTSTGGGAYVVQLGDTLSAIAARAGMTVAELAATNGIDPNGVLIAGTALRLSGGGGSGATSSGAVASGSTQPTGSSAPPYPTPERVTSYEVGSIAADNGVPASLAAAVGWQESGFNNAVVSSADARGVMQIVPGTWAWIQHNLAAGTLAPASAASNVRGGVLLLRSLLNAAGGDPALAVAGYYQGLQSVRTSGMYPSTQRYVANVLALRQQFGGP